MTDLREQIEAVIRATIFHSTAYSWYGRRSPRLSPRIRRALTPLTQRNYLVFQLQSQLYRDFYCQAMASPAREQGGGLAAAGTTHFVQALSDANCGEGYWDDGWSVSALDRDFVVARNGRLELQAGFEQCRVAGEGDLQLGTRVYLRYPKEFRSFSPGFYMASSNRPPIDDTPGSIVRVYWNIAAEGAVRFLCSATSLLNGAGLAFRLKVVNDPTLYTRCDAAVLYFHRDDYPLVARLLPELYAGAATNLKQGTPAFTKCLWGGVGLAENPGEGSSFGLHRCRILAEGLLRAHDDGKTTVAARLQAVEERFSELGINLDRPYLNPGSEDVYTFHSNGSAPSRALGLTSNSLRDLPDTGDFLQTACDIGQRLSHQALWHDGRCNWMGFAADEVAVSKGLQGLKYAALGPDLYSGTSGVALFLAELSSATGDHLARRTAIGAIRHAVLHSHDRSFSGRAGLHTGCLGIALAAAQVGTVLNEQEILDSAKQIAQSVRRTMQRTLKRSEFDVMSGFAGSISALLSLSALLGDPLLVDIAVRFGDALLMLAERDGAGLSWKSPATPNRRNLTGFSHGAAGAGYALLELFRATGSNEYREAATHAFRYERQWFIPEAGNWPDFREDTGSRRTSDPPLSFGTSWCHGAPGIALSRLRAFELLGDEVCKRETMAAVETTRGVLETWLNSGTGNFSLCHGLAGNAETLLYAHEVFGEQMKAAKDLVNRIAMNGIETYGKRVHAWPCGTHGGQTPNFMLGLAGIGYFYLRLHDPAIPSFMILRSESFRTTASPRR